MYLLFFLFWILLNGRITLEVVLFGLGISAVIYLFVCKFMDFSLRKDLLLVRSTGFLIRFGYVLLKEIVKANWAVLSMVFSPVKQPEPEFVYFEADLKSRLAKVMLANAITLTPGTITVSVEGNRYCVHCLDKSYAQGIEDSEFVQILEEMEAAWNEA